MLDFRSDTVTRPTQAMREAMAAAEVGDDVMGEDPTVTQLEEAMAGRLGMEAGLFVPSGTMGNQIALWVHTGRSGQVVCESRSHIALYEGGAAALLSGTTLRTVDGKAGVFTPQQVQEWLYPDDPHFARTKLVSLENTHNWSGGRLWPLADHDAVAKAAQDADVRVHVDGARIFNAAVALDWSPKRLLQGADSAMVCLSKGLGAPVGSVLCGDQDFIHEARRVRKALGGSMRQAGVIAAAGLYALDHHVDRLAQDHTLAQELAKALADVPGIHVGAPVETNMVLADVSGTGMAGPAFCEQATKAGVGCLPRDNGPTARFVTHLDVGPEDVDAAVERLSARAKR